jgi:hypothetical protein
MAKSSKCYLVRLLTLAGVAGDKGGTGLNCQPLIPSNLSNLFVVVVVVERRCKYRRRERVENHHINVFAGQLGAFRHFALAILVTPCLSRAIVFNVRTSSRDHARRTTFFFLAKSRFLF